MRILQINSRYEYASTGKAAKELNDALKEAGIETYIACAEWLEVNDRDNIFKIGSYVDRRLHALFSRVTGKQGHFSYFATKKLLRHISKIKPDIVHLLNLHANYINFPMLMKYLADNKIPVVVSVHDCWYFTGHCCYFLPHKCYKWQKECKSCTALDDGNKSWLFDTSKKMFAEKKQLFSQIDRLAVIGVSDWITAQAEKSFLGPSADICRRIYNWVDMQSFYPHNEKGLRKFRNTEGKFIALSVSYEITHLKGIDDITEVAKRLLEDIVIILVGTMDKQSELPANIMVIPSTNDIDELCSYYSSADVLLNLSHHETFGLVTAEALACGTPAVVYNITACPEVVGKGCGYVCEVGDYDGVANAVCKVKRTGKAAYSEKCIDYVRRNFNKEKNTKEYMKLYKEILELK